MRRTPRSRRRGRLGRASAWGSHLEAARQAVTQGVLEALRPSMSRKSGATLYLNTSSGGDIRCVGCQSHACHQHSPTVPDAQAV